MRNSFTRFIAGRKHPAAEPDEDLIALLDHVQKACKAIARLAAQGALKKPATHNLGVKARGEEQMLLDVLANSAMISGGEESGQLCGMPSEEMTAPYRIPEWRRCGRYLLIFDPLNGSSNIDVDMTVGTIFSILRAPEGVRIMNDPGQAVATVAPPMAEEVAATAAPAAAAVTEPEVLTERKPKEGEEAAAEEGKKPARPARAEKSDKEK